jgi:O-acetyl-ADP-ribose deacetylase (regulator of RNase III)
LKVDSIVSPANSFGYMRGGIDGFYTKKFGPGVEKDVQDLIKSEHDGEMLVGKAEIVETGDKNIPFCISAPTMRIGFVFLFKTNFSKNNP